jgi:HlyB family type I secretion system ABC transporter
MTYTTDAIQEFLASLYPFNQLATTRLEKLSQKFQLLRYHVGQEILVREAIPAQVSIIYEGQARLLGYEPQTQMPVTLQLLRPGEILGWISLLRSVACETAIASTDTICLTIQCEDFLTLLEQEPLVAAAFQERCTLIEVFDLLGAELERRADRQALLQASGAANLKELTLKLLPAAVILNLPPGKIPFSRLDPDRRWFISGGNVADFPVGSCLASNATETYLAVSSGGVRLVGLQQLELFPTTATDELASPASDRDRIPYAPERPPALELDPQTRPSKYPYIRGRGPLDATLACFQMLSQHLNIPFRRDVIRRILTNQLDNTGKLSLQLCGGIAELMGLSTQLVNVPASAVSRLQAPALIAWQDSFAILYKVSAKELVLAVPEVGILRKKPADLSANWSESGQVLLLKSTRDTPKQRFSLRWFLPSLYRYRRVLSEVLLASFFVQLFALANPLITQLIFDHVLLRNSVDTLYVLGILLIVVAVFEAVLTGVRTHLFADTTNRIDLALGSEVIDHLLRLPLRYFERRPVGELATRVNELENIRSFLTGTALTVVIDAVFSVIYILVMAIYSWLLTLVALATVPLFGLLTFIVSPIVRQRSRTKAERHAATHSYLVEVLSGIQTVKAQNIELRSRWQWQENYAKYISAGFKTVSTATTASSMSGFLNKLSSLLVLWVGAFLVLQGQLTLGQLIAFRIIAGYVTSPLLRLLQLWQNFQETALSLERLSDILNAPQEVDEVDRHNILMPMIQGAIKYENVTFRFSNSGPPQLVNINLDFAPGTFVGIVGLSGSGKSTLTKLIPRLYEPDAGHISIDGYDISKVELYSLRRQIGIVLQDTLLFDGTIQENIALTNPEASSEEIIAAAKVAFAHDFIMSLPNGYNTRVGERGSALSGGQRQRIAIARTVLQNPRLLILDEATSALDYLAERQVCINLAEAFKERTVLFITHRLSTIKNADQILMMDRGTIVEQGTHEQLMALEGSYYSLYQQQETQF